jgi:hypothetical protein
MNRLQRILIPLDAALAALLFAKARPYQTVSSLFWEWEMKGNRQWPRKAVVKLFRLTGDEEHCRMSWENERKRNV